MTQSTFYPTNSDIGIKIYTGDLSEFGLNDNKDSAAPTNPASWKFSLKTNSKPSHTTGAAGVAQLFELYQAGRQFWKSMHAEGHGQFLAEVAMQVNMARRGPEGLNFEDVKNKGVSIVGINNKGLNHSDDPDNADGSFDRITVARGNNSQGKGPLDPQDLVFEISKKDNHFRKDAAGKVTGYDGEESLASMYQTLLAIKDALDVIRDKEPKLYSEALRIFHRGAPAPTKEQQASLALELS
ncbi:hypothetical protein [Ferrimonas marina]|uniref:Uncharacterized protein n=1 Tax=Ferrimonas marina TaxID=299255 RepID=A0A1M5UJW9_9GAMM|nr:hypothetical protein [Ferrimonas marina]SHH63188.1 hypothetical protein SAMN02745129_2603 [Ferrimonas marina]